MKESVGQVPTATTARPLAGLVVIPATTEVADAE